MSCLSKQRQLFDWHDDNFAQVNYTELTAICNSWRNYGDIQDSWADVVDIIEWYAKNQDVLVDAAGPGHWNDPDMLIVGDISLSLEQSKSQFGSF